MKERKTIKEKKREEGKEKVKEHCTCKVINEKQRRGGRSEEGMEGGGGEKGLRNGRGVQGRKEWNGGGEGIKKWKVVGERNEEGMGRGPMEK